MFFDALRVLIPQPLPFRFLPALTKILARYPDDVFDLLLFSNYSDESQAKIWKVDFGLS